MSALQIRQVGTERLPDVEPLWLAMHAHHASLAQDLAPARAPAESWRRRREQYESWLKEGDAQLLIAEQDGRAAGYAMLRVVPGPPTWDIGERLLEVESLSVAEDARGRGIGAELMLAARAAAAEAGARRLAVGVMQANEGALRFYSREGFKPFYVELLSDGSREGERR
jgi:ribosomal protein S18 acetylase RimI-like enzyme